MNFRNSTLYVSIKDTGQLLEQALSILHAGSIRLHLHTTTGLHSTCITTTARRINQVVLEVVSPHGKIQVLGARHLQYDYRRQDQPGCMLRTQHLHTTTCRISQKKALALQHLHTTTCRISQKKALALRLLSTALASRLPQAGSTRFHAQHCTCTCSALHLHHDYRKQDQPGFMLSTALASRLPQAGSTRFHAQHLHTTTGRISQINPGTPGRISLDSRTQALVLIRSFLLQPAHPPSTCHTYRPLPKVKIPFPKKGALNCEI